MQPQSSFPQRVSVQQDPSGELLVSPPWVLQTSDHLVQNLNAVQPGNANEVGERQVGLGVTVPGDGEVVVFLHLVEDWSYIHGRPSCGAEKPSFTRSCSV